MKYHNNEIPYVVTSNEMNNNVVNNNEIPYHNNVIPYVVILQVKDPYLSTGFISLHIRFTIYI